MTDCNKDDKRSSIVSGTIILGVGLFFLAVNYGWLDSVGESWPLFLVIVGVALIVGNIVNKRRSDDELNPPPSGS